MSVRQTRSGLVVGQLKSGSGRIRFVCVDRSIGYRLAHHEELPARSVITTDPGAGTTVDEGSVVAIEVSAGPRPVRLPAIAGQQVGDARATLEARGLDLEVVDDRHDETPAGRREALDFLTRHLDASG